MENLRKIFENATTRKIYVSVLFALGAGGIVSGAMHAASNDQPAAIKGIGGGFGCVYFGLVALKKSTPKI